MINENKFVIIGIGFVIVLASILSIAQPVLDVSSNFFAPSWNGDSAHATFTEGWTDNPHSGPTCIKITYSPSNDAVPDSVKISWLYPASNRGNERGLDLSKYSKLTFYARGKGEKVEFGMGGLGGSLKSPVRNFTDLDSNNMWKMYNIDLGSQDRSNVIVGFYCNASKKDNPNGCEIYLDDITYQ